jgi:predicted Zn-dependent protease
MRLLFGSLQLSGVKLTCDVLVASLHIFPLAKSQAQGLPALPSIVLENCGPEIREQVRKAYTDAQTKPRDAQASGWLGMTLHTYEQYEFASVCYERAHLLAPTEFRWAYYLGVVQAELGKQHEVATAFKAALRQDPNHLPAQLRLANALLAASQLSESRKWKIGLTRSNFRKCTFVT